MKSNEIINNLNIMIPNPKCELKYNKDYELLIATMLSAQCTDKRVNMVTEKMFKDHDIYSLNKLDNKSIIKYIRSLGNFTKKSSYIKAITSELIDNYNGTVPNDRKFLESIPGVGRKTCNVVLAELFNEPTIAVDTHVLRVSKRLGITRLNDPLRVEKRLMKYFNKEDYNRVNHQLVLFGRYICTAVKPNCEKCLFSDNCKYKKSSK